MGSIRSNTALAADFPVTAGSLQATIDRVDHMAQNSYIAGAALAQVLGSIGTAMDVWAEVAGTPSASYAGAAGTTTRYYAAVLEYGLAIDNPPRPFPYRNVKAMPGAPVQGRGPLGNDRTKRYSKISTAVAVGNTALKLSATDVVSVTAPAYGGAVAGVTYAIIATDVAGNPLAAVAQGVAPGATVQDIGLVPYGAAVPNLPLHAEYAVIPATAASGVVMLTGTFSAGGLLQVDVGGLTAQHAPAGGDTDLAGVASALAAAIVALQPLVSAVATGASITITAHANGPAGNLAISTRSTNGTIGIAGSPMLAGGTSGGGVYGPRTRVSGPAGV